jgi:hypothetical protein
MQEMSNAYNIFVGTPVDKRQLVFRKNNNIKIDLEEIGCENMVYIQLAQDEVQRGRSGCDNERSVSVKVGSFLTS